MNSYFPEIDQKSWSQLRTLCEPHYPASRSIYIPMNLPFHKDMVFQTPDFSVMTEPLPVREDLRSDLMPEDSQISELLHRMLNFFPDEPPMIPDYRLTQLRYSEPGVPILESSFFLRDLVYHLESFVPPSDPQQAVMRMRFTVANEGDREYEGNVRLHLSLFKEGHFGFAYYPIQHNADTLLLADESFQYRDGMFFLGDGAIACVRSGAAWKCAYEPVVAYPPEAYNHKGIGTHHHFVVIPSIQQIHSGRNFLRLSTMLKPGESRSFEVDFALADNVLPTCSEDYESARSRCLDYYRTVLSKCIFHSDREEYDAIVRDLQTDTLQLTLDTGTGEGYLKSCQGYCARIPMWTFEAFYAMNGMLEFGHFEASKKVLELILSWQDAGCPPEGKFTTTAGAIGTTGPRWANTTGCALMFAARYVILSGDHDFYRKHADGLLRAAQWILGEVAETDRHPELPYSGIMPPACAADEDIGCLFCSTDNMLLAGVNSLLAVPDFKTHPEYESVRRGAERYRENFRRIIESLKRPDGFIPRQLNLGKPEKVFKKFDLLCGSCQLLESGVIRADEEITRRLFEYLEHNACREFWLGVMDRDCIYLSFGDLVRQTYYLQTGQWKKAWGVMRYLLLYGMTPDLHLFQERYSISESSYVPFQPNASANGRTLVMLKQRFFLTYQTIERIETVLLLGGVAPFEYEDHPDMELSGMPSDRGTFDLHIRNGILTLAFSREQSMPWQLRIPEHFRFVCSMAEVTALTGNRWNISAGVRKISGTLALEKQPDLSDRKTGGIRA